MLPLPAQVGPTNARLLFEEALEDYHSEVANVSPSRRTELVPGPFLPKGTSGLNTFMKNLHTGIFVDRNVRPKRGNRLQISFMLYICVPIVCI